MKSYKFYSIAFFSLFLSIEIYAQNKIIEVFGKEKYEQLATHYPDSIKYYTFLLNDGFDIMLKKYADVERLSTAKLLTLPIGTIENGIPQKAKINILLLPVEFHKEHYQYYRIENTDYVLRLKPLDYIEKKYKAQSK
ncbi:MAG: hypothetical protein N2449_09615 [Bacteroidales bacterium]|nr:hypothetical protein [Bacteroidales bacterium]